MLEVLQMLYRYNSAMTARLLDALELLTPEEYNAPGCSGHGSIRDTLAHLLAAQWSWFSWFDRSMEAAEADALDIKGEEIESLAEARRRWMEIDEQTNRCVAALTEEGLREEWSETLPSGRTWSLPLWQIVLHVANHGTHTRAQLVAAIRRAGHKPGDYEIVNFAIRERMVR
jgi:uncharacterized damage-inducible protein DinB